MYTVLMAESVVELGAEYGDVSHMSECAMHN